MGWIRCWGTESGYRMRSASAGSLPDSAQFDAVITSEDVENGKPHPDCYLMASEQLAIEPAACLVLEDSNDGMRAGLDAGCKAVMIPDLLPPSADVAQRAHAILGSLADVHRVL